MRKNMHNDVVNDGLRDKSTMPTEYYIGVLTLHLLIILKTSRAYSKDTSTAGLTRSYNAGSHRCCL